MKLTGLKKGLKNDLSVYGYGYDKDEFMNILDDYGYEKDSSIAKKSDREVLDEMDITVIENYLREKKLLKIKKLIKK
jgi:GTPase